MYILKFKSYSYTGLEFKFEKMEDASKFAEDALTHSVDGGVEIEFRFEEDKKGE